MTMSEQPEPEHNSLESSDATLPDDPVDPHLEAFWDRARTVAGFNRTEVLTGLDDTASLRPSAFSLGATQGAADELAGLVVAGKKTATSSWLAAYEHEGAELPRVGELSIICDGVGHPRALIRDTEVRVLGFDEADHEIAAAEGEGPFDYWKSAHEAFFRQECETLGIEYDPAGKIVVEFFEVLYKH